MQPSIQTGKITTSGGCSPVVIRPNKTFTIECSGEGLSPAELKKQAQQFADILTQIKLSGAKEDRIIDILQELRTLVGKVSDAAKSRIPTTAQLEEIVDTAKLYPDTQMTVYVFPGEPRAVTESYLNALEKQAGWTKIKTIYPVMPGSYMGATMLLSADDWSQNTLPPGCIALNQLLVKMGLFHIGTAMKDGDPIRVPRGTCAMYIGNKEGIPQ